MAPVVTYPTLEHVAMQARPYPDALLEDCETGLCLFAAAFLGHNDAIHFARHDVTTVCVDTDSDRLAAMRELYPADWLFVDMDAFQYARAAQDLALTWDAVSADTFTGTEWDERAAEAVQLWASLANRLVTFTLTAAMGRITPPAGWELARYERSHGIHWGVLTRG